jgi:PPM family protein phosphatase
MIEDQSEKENENLAGSDQLSILVDSAQSIGSRGNQEDAFALERQKDQGESGHSEVLLAVVADGMGGLDRGEEASALAVEVLLDECKKGNLKKVTGEVILRALKIANAAVFDLALDQQGNDIDLGTTLVAVVINGNALEWIAVGDSRIYLFRNNNLEQLNRDHIYAYHLADDVHKGIISENEAASHPEKNYLTSYLGLMTLDEIDRSVEPLKLKSGDRLLLCSDGLYDTLSAEVIVEVLENDSKDVAKELVARALAQNNSHQDNITVIAISCLSLEQ